MTSANLVRPYLPRPLVEWLATEPDRTHRAVEGSLLFSDVSGFTRLSERLARHGKAGAEELVGIISECFADLLASAYDEDGSLLKFGGDAMLLLFAGEGHALRAARTALAMQAALRRMAAIHSSDVHVRLRLSAGVSSGDIHLFLVGESHRELLVVGPAASAAARMEATADAGETVVSPATSALLPADFLGDPKGDGILLRRRGGRRRTHGRPPRPPEVDEELLLACLPVAVRDHLISEGRDAEHRFVTVAFVKYTGTDALITERGPAVATAHLDALTSRVQRAVDRHGVSFLATDVDADGGKFMLAAGAPRSTDDDATRMLLALREIVADDGPLSVRAGVNCGHVFAGDAGPSYRRTYTTMGDAVNLAARVMAKATPGTVLATDAVLRRAATAFRAEPVEPFMVKGKSRPVHAAVVGAPIGGRRLPTGDGVAMVGREAELTQLVDSLAGLRVGRGGPVEIIGEAGIGKSRLVAELAARADDVTWLQAACEPFETSTPYFPFRSLLRAALGIDHDAPPDTVARHLREAVADAAPELKPWLPLLAIPLDVAVEPTDEVDQLDERFRRERLELAVGDLLARVLTGPTVLVVDDAHLVDEPSADLLRHLVTRARVFPWLLVVVRREAGPVLVDDAAVVIRPAQLGADDAAEFLEALTVDAPLSPHEVAVLATRASGNPLFLHELVAASREVGSVDDLPDSVEALVTARIDRLGSSQRAVLRQLAGLGMSFALDLATAVVGDVAWTELDEFVERSEGVVRFRHAVTRDVAYHGLSFRLRRALHAAAADSISTRAGEDLATVAEALSFHYHHAERYEESFHHSTVAAAQAEAAYANAEAATFLERAIDAGRRAGVAEPDLAAAFESLATARLRLGAYEGADRAFRTARRVLRDDPVADARLSARIARLQAYVQRAENGRRWVSRALRRLDGVETPAAAVERANLMACNARFWQAAGNHRAAIRWCEKAIDAARDAAAREALAESYRVLTWALVELGRPEAATHLPQALAIFEEVGDLSGQASILNALGASAYWEGRWAEALDYYERAGDLLRRTGDSVTEAFCTMNIGEILCDQGRVEEAEAHFRRGLRVWQAAKHRVAIAYVKTNLARVALRAGRYADALRLYEEARADSLDVGARADVLESDARMAECLAMQGHWAQALAMAEDGLSHARALGGVAPQTPLLHRVRGTALLNLGDVDAAHAALDESLASGRVRHSDYEIALTLRVMSQVHAEQNGGPDLDLDAESRAIFDRLGVDSAFV